MNSIERGMNDWHYKFNVPKTASDSQFYKQFGDDFDRRFPTSSGQKSTKEILDEVEAELKEKNKHKEYLDAYEDLDKWDLVDHASFFWRGLRVS